jgi:hypothetical protein
MELTKAFIKQIQEIIASAKERAIRSVDNERVLMYWQIGKLILEEEQFGRERAGYGEFLIQIRTRCIRNSVGHTIAP